MKFRLSTDRRSYELEIRSDGERFFINCEGKNYSVRFKNAHLPLIHIEELGIQKEVGFSFKDGKYEIIIDGISYEFSLSKRSQRESPVTGGTKGLDIGPVEVRAPIPGLITSVMVKEGEMVRKDQPLLMLDAMKLENEIAAPRDARVESVKVSQGMTVDKGDLLVLLR
jgi:biotin carboxyl carrier protein